MEGFISLYMAAAAEICGTAIEVPLADAYLPFSQQLLIFTPGATTSSVFP
jgi:hypothetical protein